jgi:tetratricopeptide (TPR) repeat protein
MESHFSCTNCGRTNPATFKFCSGCGKQLDNSHSFQDENCILDIEKTFDKLEVPSVIRQIISGNENVVQNTDGDNNTTVGVVSENLTVNKIFENVRAGGDITVGNITQIYQTISNLDNIPKPTGFPQNIPNSSTDKFVGREGELNRLHEQLQRNNSVVIAAVEGMGGVGKTELAIQYSLLHLQLRNYPGGICWLRATDADIGLQIVNFVRTDLGLQPPSDLELPDQVRWCWKHWREGNTLLVLDDVKNYSNIKAYLPPQPSQFKVLITTRLKLDLAGSLYLSVLSSEDALQLLSQLVGGAKVNQELEKAKELCQRLGYLPLALQLVGRYANKRKVSLPEMLQRLEEKGLGHPSLIVKDSNPTWTLNIKQGVEAAFGLSWLELTEPAQQLGCLLSLFALAPIPWSLVESAAVEQDSEELEDIRLELENLHLLQGGETYQLHQLIQEFLSNKQTGLRIADEQKYNFCSAMVKAAGTIPETPILEEINKLAPIIPHLAKAAAAYKDWFRDEDLISPFAGLGRFYKGQGAYTQALPWQEQCVSVAKERLGEDHPDVATSYNNLASVYDSQGRYREAEPLYQKALELRQRLLGEDHPDVATSYNNLAYLYNSQGRYTEAEPLFQKALELRQRLLREDHPDVATSYNNLAYLYNSQGRYTEAEPLYQKALELRQRLLGEDHPDVATSYNNLAGLYESQGRYREAEPLYQKALELRQRLLGEDHPDVATSYNNLAYLYNSQGRYREAEPLFQKALELRQRLLGEDHPDVATSYNNLAYPYKSQGRYREAEPLFQKALELRQRLLGEDHPSVATSYNNLAGLYNSQGRYREAEPLFQKALQILEQQLGAEHPNTIIVRNNLESLSKTDD